MSATIRRIWISTLFALIVFQNKSLQDFRKCELLCIPQSEDVSAYRLFCVRAQKQIDIHIRANLLIIIMLIRTSQSAHRRISPALCTNVDLTNVSKCTGLDEVWMRWTLERIFTPKKVWCALLNSGRAFLFKLTFETNFVFWKKS